MKNVLYFIIFLLIFTVIGCEDRFSQVIEFDIPDHEAKIVSYCFLSENDDKIVVALSKSQGTLEEDNSKITNAQVKLLKDNQDYINDFEIEKVFSYFDYSSFPYDSIFDYYYTADMPSPLQLDVDYTLEISSDGFTTIQSTVSLPKAVEIYDAIYIKDSGTDPDGFIYDEVEIKFDDLESEENYYLISGVIRGENNGDSFTEGVNFDDKDPRIKLGNANLQFGNNNSIGKNNLDYLYFADNEGFNGKTNRLKFIVDSNYIESGSEIFMDIRMYSISKEFYHFINTYNLYERSNNNIFSEPVSLTSNMENGFGLFTLYNYDEVEIEIE